MKVHTTISIQPEIFRQYKLIRPEKNLSLEVEKMMKKTIEKNAKKTAK